MKTLKGIESLGKKSLYFIGQQPGRTRVALGRVGAAIRMAVIGTLALAPTGCDLSIQQPVPDPLDGHQFFDAGCPENPDAAQHPPAAISATTTQIMINACLENYGFREGGEIIVNNVDRCPPVMQKFAENGDYRDCSLSWASGAQCTSGANTDVVCRTLLEVGMAQSDISNDQFAVLFGVGIEYCAENTQDPDCTICVCTDLEAWNNGMCVVCTENTDLATALKMMVES